MQELFDGGPIGPVHTYDNVCLDTATGKRFFFHFNAHIQIYQKCANETYSKSCIPDLCDASTLKTRHAQDVWLTCDNKCYIIYKE